MNVNVENAPTVRLRAEFTEPALDQLGRVAGQSGPIRERINGAQFKFTNVTKFDVKELQGETEKIEFDFVGLDPAIYNTLRRIMLAEVPSMAIERVLIYNNTSLIQDEVLAHRLGLIPLNVDARKFVYKKENEKVDLQCVNEKEANSAKYAPKENDTVKFSLKVECKKQKNGELANGVVYSNQLKWHPVGNQKETLGDAKAVFSDIIINKLRPKQAMDIELLAHKGIGRDHAKFSPVCTAFYRLLPTITLSKQFKGEEAQKLQKCFSPGVISIEDNVATVCDARLDACTREAYRHAEFKNHVEFGRVRSHALFSIETVGALTPSEIFLESLKILRNKCDAILAQVEEDDKEEDDDRVREELDVKME